MPIKVLRKYGENATLNFTLWQNDGVNFQTAANFEAGEVIIMKNEGAESNTDNLPTDEGIGYSLVLSAGEMTTKRAIVYIVDNEDKTWLDDYIIVETYGHANAMHRFNLDYDFSENGGTDKIHFGQFKVLNELNNEPAVLFRSEGVNGQGLLIESAQTGDAVKINAANGHGISVDANGSGKHGLSIVSDEGDGILAEGGSTGHGIHAKSGEGSGAKGGLFESVGATFGAHGLACVSSTGDGLYCASTGQSPGHGIHAIGNKDGYNGIFAEGYGSGAGAKFKGGLTGDGARLEGGATSGNGLTINAVNGHGINIQVDGTTKHAILAQAAGSGSFGLSCVGISKDIDAAELEGLIKTTTSIDGIAVDTILQYAMAMFNGKFDEDKPSPGYKTFYKRNNVTTLSVVRVTTAGRTRIS